jgi:ribonucleoside-diphosphate reductase beta chain
MNHIVFNEEKTAEDYMQLNQPLFFGKPFGLVNTVYKPYPKIWSIYKNMKSLSWSEDEFDYSQCLNDFKSCSKSVYEMMIKTLAAQWEMDSVANRAISPVFAPFITDTSLWAAWLEINLSEQIHSNTYSSIVRLSFDNPEDVISEILKVKESFARMDKVNTVFDNLYTTSHKYALGMITVDEAYDDLFMGVVALFLLERIQFMASFAITFTICSTGLFQPIGKAVQKICQDELEAHAELDKEVIKVELATERGRACYLRNKEKIKELCDSVVESEMEWTEYLFSEGRELVGANEQTVKNWVLFNARVVYSFLDIESEYKFPKHNPMPNL